MAENVNAVVMGMGVGGEEVAGRLAEQGFSVVGIEERLLGGECPYWGCVPTKMMVRAAMLLAEARRIKGMAGDSTVQPDWSPVAQRIREEATDDWDDKVAVDRFVSKGGRFVRGHAEITGPGEVTVGDQVFVASRAIVIANGTAPVIPPIEGLHGTPYWTNREAVETATLPRSLAVLGGGAVGLELAQVFARFGAAVTVVEMADRLLPVEEPEASEVVRVALESEGIAVLTDARVTRVRHQHDTFSLDVEGAGVTRPVEADRLLVATGRRADLAGIGADQVGIDTSARWVPVDERMRAAPGVWAVGDVTGKGVFTHVAFYQAGVAVPDILGEDGPAADYRAVPRVTFTDPEVGAVGLTEEQARDAGLRVRVAVAQVPSSARGWIHKAGNEGVIKLIEDADRGILVGATSAGPAGGEVLGALSVAVHGKVPTQTLRGMIYAYPTFHRAIEDALRELH